MHGKTKTQQKSRERRSGNDRRCWHCQHEFPYIDSHGMLVTENRRREERRDCAPPSQMKSLNTG